MVALDIGAGCVSLVLVVGLPLAWIAAVTLVVAGVLHAVGVL